MTGGAGFIGSHVVDRLLDGGYEVLVIDDLSTGDRANVAAPAAELAELDICDETALSRRLAEFAPTAVCHLAAQASVTFSVRVPARDFEVNVRGTFNVCRAAADAGAPVVFASTGGALYGDGAPLPTPEEHPPRPLSPYGASKLAGESYVATWGRLHGLPNVVLRLGNVYGPRQNPHGEAGVVAIFSERLVRGERPTVYGDGKPTRDYVHVSDVASAFVTAAEGGLAGTFNVGTGVETSVEELLRRLQEVAGTSLEPEYAPLRAGELERSSLQPTLMADSLGWRAQVAVDDGLAQTFGAYARA